MQCQCNYLCNLLQSKEFHLLGNRDTLMYNPYRDFSTRTSTLSYFFSTFPNYEILKLSRFNISLISFKGFCRGKGKLHGCTQVMLPYAVFGVWMKCFETVFMSWFYFGVQHTDFTELNREIRKFSVLKSLFLYYYYYYYYYLQ